MKVAALALGVAGVVGKSDWAKYDEFVKAFHPNEDESTFYIFQDNLAVIDKMQANDPSATYSYVTKFAAISAANFAKRNRGYRPREGATSAPLLDAPLLNASNVASSFDWRDHGAVHPVRDQGACGSCWAFSAVASIEGVGKAQTGKLPNLSEQQLLNCDNADDGCNGGLPSNAFQFLVDQGFGLGDPFLYPYYQEKEKCYRSDINAEAFVTAWRQISTDETQIAAAVQQYGPLSIAINANTFQFYSKGIANPSICDPRALDHAVAIVGFGSESGQDYWTIRNSWGWNWGEAGYIRMARGSGKCGLNTDVTTATGVRTVAKTEESTVLV